MKKLYLTLLLIVCWIVPTAAQFQILTPITQEEALVYAKKEFEGRDVDYYSYDKTNSDHWIFFVDAEPTLGWEHECYLVRVNKTPEAVPSTLAVTKTQYSMPPSGDFSPIDVKNRYGVNANVRPVVSNQSSFNDVSDAAQKTYAIILSGGHNRISNYQRYWNDCSFIYQTLVNTYGVPKENITPIMSDGDDPAADMNIGKGHYASQPLDLDNDGEADIKLAATYSNVESTLSKLSRKLSKDDHLFIYVIDHGGSNDNISQSYINLWNGEKLQDWQLASMLQPFTDKLVNVNVVLGQCKSGGFIDDLSKVGCVIATACMGNQNSKAYPDIPFDEFVYHWTCAVNGANHKGAKINADSDSNNRLTMQEAFAYAVTNDRWSTEQPQYTSTPVSIGQDLAFNYIPPSVDLYIKDNLEDTGQEPNLTTDKFWISPSIWVRNQRDDKYEHENPEYSYDHTQAFIYVRVHNRGKENFDGNGVWVHVYWALASTGLTPKTWKGRETYESRHPTGGNLTAVPISAIPAGGYIDIMVPWSLPLLMNDYIDEEFHFCLLAKLMNRSYDDGYVEGKTYFDLQGCNDHAQKNITIVKGNDFEKNINVYVRNISDKSQSYTLELVPRGMYLANLYSNLNIKMEMSPKIYNAWGRGGYVCQNVQLPAVSATGGAARTVKFLSSSSKLQKISLAPNEFDVIKMNFSCSQYASIKGTYTFDLIQKDENGKIVGGETFVVTPPSLSIVTPQISSVSIGNAQYQLSVDGEDFESLTWKNESNEVLGKEDTIIVTPTMDNTNFSIVALTEDGKVATDEIKLNPEYQIKNVSATSENLTIELNKAAPANAKLIVVSVMDSTQSISKNISENIDVAVFDTKALASGLYVVTYYVNDEVMDNIKVSIK